MTPPPSTAPARSPGRQLRRHERCLNCDAPVDGNFCSECGQENSDYRVSLWRLLGDLSEELFQLESRLWRSLVDLFRHPGRLTGDYNAGRRVRYTSPLRLYLMASVAYFFVGALVPSPADPDLQIELGNTQGELKKLGPPDNEIDRFVRHRLDLHEGSDFRQVQQHVSQLLNVNAPRVMALLVPLFALLTMAFFRRPRLFFVEHLVLALHVHAVAFWALLVATLTRIGHAPMAALLVPTIWLALALRTLFAQSWWRTIVKLTVVVTIYLVLVACGIVVALVI